MGVGSVRIVDRPELVGDSGGEGDSLGRATYAVSVGPEAI
jgi:hypothetical protein